MKNGMMNKKLSLTKNDFEIQTFSAGGPGGQHQNKTSTAVRIIHKESGAFSECRNFKSQKQNKQEAFKRLTKNPKFKLWLNKKLINEEEIENKINELMKPQFIKTEYL